MKRNSIRLLAAALLLSPLTVFVTLTQAQERQLALERILDPMPDYDPFEKSQSTPLFFPDEVDKRAREMLIDALTNRKESLDGHVKFLEIEDSRLQKQHGAATGLTERAQDLVNNTVADRERYLATQKEALRNASSPERKKYLESIINQDDLNQSEQLMRQSSTNFWGGMANRLLSSVDLVGIASGNYVGAAVETAISQLYALADRDMPVEERRALARDLAHLKRYPDDPRNGAILKHVEALDKKKMSLLVRKQLDRAKEATGKGDFERALFHVDMATFLDPQSRDAEEIRQKAAKPLREIEEARKKSLAAVSALKTDAEQEKDVARLLEALTLRDSNQIQRVAIDVEKKYRGKPLADAARDAEAVGLELKGWREAAKKAIDQMAKSALTPEAKQRAAALLQSPEYNLLTPFQEARTERQLQSVKYVLLGEDFLRKNLLFAAGAMAAAGPAAAATLGMANAIMVGNNFYQVMMNNPVSSQPVIDAGVAYVRNHPNSENAAEVYKVLADAFEERGMWDKAIGYHELAGSPKEKNRGAERSIGQGAFERRRQKRRARQPRVLFDHRRGSASRYAGGRGGDEKTRRASQRREPGFAHEQTVLDGEPRALRAARHGLEAGALRRQPKEYGNRRTRYKSGQRQRSAGLLSDAVGCAQPELPAAQEHYRPVFRHAARKKPSSGAGRRQPARQRQRRWI